MRKQTADGDVGALSSPLSETADDDAVVSVPRSPLWVWRRERFQGTVGAVIWPGAGAGVRFWTKTGHWMCYKLWKMRHLRPGLLLLASRSRAPNQAKASQKRLSELDANLQKELKISREAARKMKRVIQIRLTSKRRTEQRLTFTLAMKAAFVRRLKELILDRSAGNSIRASELYSLCHVEGLDNAQLYLTADGASSHTLVVFVYNIHMLRFLQSLIFTLAEYRHVCGKKMETMEMGGDGIDTNYIMAAMGDGLMVRMLLWKNIEHLHLGPDAVPISATDESCQNIKATACSFIVKGNNPDTPIHFHWNLTDEEYQTDISESLKQGTMWEYFSGKFVSGRRKYAKATCSDCGLICVGAVEKLSSGNTALLAHPNIHPPGGRCEWIGSQTRQKKGKVV